MTDPEITCASRVSWWDGEYEGECELPEGHEPPHTDGLSCWDDEGEEIHLAVPDPYGRISGLRPGGRP